MVMISAQQRVQQYFPGQSITIDPMAYEEIRKFDRSLYIEDKGGNYEKVDIPIKKIVGTVNKWGGKGYTWAAVLEGNKFNLSHWNYEHLKDDARKERRIEEIQNRNSDDIYLYRDVMKDEYYIHSEGHHRISLWKCIGWKTISATILDHYPKPALPELLKEERNEQKDRCFLERIFSFFKTSDNK